MTDSKRQAERTSDPEDALERAAWPELDEALVDKLREAGTSREVEAGEVLFEVGQETYDFLYIERGAVEIVDRAMDRTVVRIGAGDFVGELGMLMGHKTFLAGVACEAGSLICVPQETIRELVATVPEIADVVVTAFAARRRLLMRWEEGGLVLLGEGDDPAATALREFAARNRIPHRWVDRADKDEVAELAEACELPASGTAAVVGHAEVLVEPTPRDLARALGLDLPIESEAVFDMVVVGAGPAGLAAALFGASEGLDVLVIEDTAIGGQAGASSRIENYLGFPRGLSGTELAYRGEVQAVKFGARFATPRRAVKIRADRDPLVLELDDGGEVRGRTIVLANGVQYRRLPLARMSDFEGCGVYYAATELEARFCHRTEAVIVGGGNSAGQAAMFLSRHAERATLVVRESELEEFMSSYLSERIVNDERIELRTDSEVTELHGDDVLEAVTVRHRETGETERIDTRALFVMIGAEPNTGWLDDTIALDDQGYIKTGHRAGPDVRSFATSAPGVFAVGDIRAGSVKRVASAVGEGSVVVAAVHRYLEEVSGR